MASCSLGYGVCVAGQRHRRGVYGRVLRSLRARQVLVCVVCGRQLFADPCRSVQIRAGSICMQPHVSALCWHVLPLSDGTVLTLPCYQTGKYSCVVCDRQLFESTDKFETACGWPAFSLASPAVEVQVDEVDYAQMNGHNHSQASN